MFTNDLVHPHQTDILSSEVSVSFPHHTVRCPNLYKFFFFSKHELRCLEIFDFDLSHSL